MNNKLFGTIFGFILVVAVVWYGYASWQSYRPNTSGPRQAIFLGDGQTYFGYASSLKNKTVTLVDVYFLRPQASATNTPTSTAVDTTKIDLLKLGLGGPDDLVGSQDKMVINRDAIKYIEDMRDDSQINKKITDYLNSKK